MKKRIARASEDIRSETTCNAVFVASISSHLFSYAEFVKLAFFMITSADYYIRLSFFAIGNANKSIFTMLYSCSKKTHAHNLEIIANTSYIPPMLAQRFS